MTAPARKADKAVTFVEEYAGRIAPACAITNASFMAACHIVDDRKIGATEGYLTLWTVAREEGLTDVAEILFDWIEATARNALRTGDADEFMKALNNVARG